MIKGPDQTGPLSPAFQAPTVPEAQETIITPLPTRATSEGGALVAIQGATGEGLKEKPHNPFVTFAPERPDAILGLKGSYSGK